MAGQEFDFRLEKSDSARDMLVAVASGGLGDEACALMKDLLDEAIRDGARWILLDLRAAFRPTPSSDGLRTLLGAILDLLEPRRGALALCLAGGLLAWLELAGLGAAYPVFEDPGEARDFLAGMGDRPWPPSRFPMEFACPRCGKPVPAAGPGLAACPGCEGMALVGASGRARPFPPDKTPAPETNEAIVPGFDEGADEELRLTLARIEGLENGLVVRMEGCLDSSGSAGFMRRVGLAVEAGFKRLCFDLGGLRYSEDFGIGSLTQVLKTVRPRGGDIVLFGIQPKVFELFQLLGFSQFFAIREDEAAAALYLRDGPSRPTGPAFPRIFSCPICSKPLKAAAPGRFRCSECSTILALDEAGSVTLG